MNIIDKINSTENCKKDLNSSVVNKVLIGISSILCFFSAVLCFYCLYIYKILIDKYNYLPCEYTESLESLGFGYLYNYKFITFLLIVFFSSIKFFLIFIRFKKRLIFLL